MALEKSVNSALTVTGRQEENVGAGGHSVVGIYGHCLRITSLTHLPRPLEIPCLNYNLKAQF